MKKDILSTKEALEILRKSGSSDKIVHHCEAVANVAVSIAEKCICNGTDVDIQLVQNGALLHDIGRSKTHGINHPVEGAKIADSLGLSDKLISIIKSHLGGGISVYEAKEFGWPDGCYMPRTNEEMIVSYADKLIENDRVIPIEKTIKNLQKELGENHPSIERVLRLHKNVINLCEKKS